MTVERDARQQVAAGGLRALPAVDELLRSGAVAREAEGLPPALAAEAVRAAVADVRRTLLEKRGSGGDSGELASAGRRRAAGFGEVPRSGHESAAETETGMVSGHESSADVRARAEAAALHRISLLRRSLLGRVVNATGVILHTNLGRAPLSARALEAAADAAAGYSNLEFDVPSGRRGLRDLHGETLLTALTGAEAALVVNNNAGAVLLVLSALARGREVLLSRGEMIEIGGAFRIPEVMEQSGCLLREVGTTNRTHLRDYEAALGDDTGAILKVHPSNYRVVGFTAAVDARDLAPLARRHGLPLIEDLGSGVLVDTGAYGLAAEPTVQSRIEAGIDVVTFSGDKLLGGPQAGIIVGRKQFVDACRRHPLARALRVDKMTLAALQATLLEYLHGRHDELPIYKMMAVPAETVRSRAETAMLRLARVHDGSPLDMTVVKTKATVGGGSLPGETVPSAALRLQSAQHSVDELAAALRRHRPPVVGRVEGDAVLLDFRTVAPREDPIVVEAVAALLRERPSD